MSLSQDLCEDNKSANEALSAFAAAASSCGGPQFLSFVRFNDSHLPSTLPRTFLAAHAAFCIKDGEAPQVPDYLLTDLGTEAPQSRSCNESLVLAQSVGTSVPGVGSGIEKAKENIGGKPCKWGPKSFQCKALRLALNFSKAEGLDVKSFKNPLIKYLLECPSVDVSPPSTGDAFVSKVTNRGGMCQDSQQATTSSSDALANPLVSDNADTAGHVENVSAPDGAAASQTSGDTEKRTRSREIVNPLLDETQDGNMQTPGSSCRSPSPAKPRDSEEPKRKKRRGLNTAAMRHKNLEQVSNECIGSALCLSQAACGRCLTRQCTKEHDIAAFMKTRPDDLEGDCVFFSRHGICPYGCCCRFGSCHLDALGSNILRDKKSVTEADLQKYQELRSLEELNVLDNQFRTSIATEHRQRSKANGPAGVKTQSAPVVEGSGNLGVAAAHTALASEAEELPCLPTCVTKENPVPMGAIAMQNDDAGPEERRRRFVAQVKGKTFLAPLTTLGNLPFRRLCTRLGADVTVSEMAVANSLIEGKPSELCLLRRHHTEEVFGVQIAAGFPDVARNCGKMFHDCNISCDFIDLNIACPLDQLHRRFKAGSCMLEKPAVVESVVKSLMESCPSVPVTLKVRTAHYGKKHQLHTSIGRLSRSGVAAIFAHGRTAQQRYSKSADWNYLTSCKKLMAEDVLLVGCGDILSSAEFNYREQTAGLDALMIGRGALIKPWIFTEIKEQRLWDISASERLAYVKEFVDNGLEHWGSDSRGVATTRRFLLELLSFMHRYIPPPFLELQPQLIHWRPSPFRGRSDLEVKLSSSKPQDWVEISSMFLGPPPKGFTFVPKHASSAYYVADS